MKNKLLLEFVFKIEKANSFKSHQIKGKNLLNCLPDFETKTSKWFIHEMIKVIKEF